eukprot:gene35244-43458_t
MDDLLNIYIAKHVPDMANFRPKFIPLNPTYIKLERSDISPKELV